MQRQGHLLASTFLVPPENSRGSPGSLPAVHSLATGSSDPLEGVSFPTPTATLTFSLNCRRETRGVTSWEAPWIVREAPGVLLASERTKFQFLQK